MAEINEEAKWYVVHTLTGYEKIACDNLIKTVEKMDLGDRILEVKIPMEEAIEEKNGKKKVVERKMFPCYVLLKMKYQDNLWHTIVNTHGVTGFVGPQGRPLPLTDDEIRKMHLEKIVIDINVKAGDMIKITSGPLEGFAGKVISVDQENQKARVNVEMFGRETPVDVDFDSIDFEGRYKVGYAFGKWASFPVERQILRELGRSALLHRP